MNLSKIDGLLKTLAAACALLTGSTYAGLIPPTGAIILGLVAALLAGLSSSPLFDPSLVGKTPIAHRVLLTLAALSSAAAGSSFFPAVQQLFSDGHAQKIAAALTLVTALCTLLAQSPWLAGGTAGAGGPVSKLGIALIFGLGLGVSSCATMQPIVTDVQACAGPACADVATKILPAVEVILECDAAAGFSPSALPACAENGLAALAAASGPDGWRIVGCITNALERDLAKPEGVRVRASAARKLAARKANGR